MVQVVASRVTRPALIKAVELLSKGDDTATLACSELQAAISKLRKDLVGKIDGLTEKVNSKSRDPAPYGSSRTQGEFWSG
jgi:hypothetical protein